MLVSSALVLLMTAPGLALFYGGMVRQKNVLGTLMQSFIILALISVQWVLWGYSLAFGPDKGGIIGGPRVDRAARRRARRRTRTTRRPFPHQAFMLFQMMFAIITPALITGAFAERKKFSAFLLFILLWATLVYDPLAHWVWGDGRLAAGTLGALDFAGGTVVHISSGVSALVCALVIGKRRGLRPPADAAAQPADDRDGRGAAVVRLVRLQRGQRARGQRPRGAARSWPPTPRPRPRRLGWMFTEWMSRGKPTVLGAASGAVAGLVAITPAAGFVTPDGRDRHRRGGRRHLLHAPAT